MVIKNDYRTYSCLKENHMKGLNSQWDHGIFKLLAGILEFSCVVKSKLRLQKDEKIKFDSNIIHLLERVTIVAIQPGSEQA